jgi:hypothetical protein
VFAGSYSGDKTPSTAVVADEITTGTDVHPVLARSVQNACRHGVGTSTTVEIVLIGETGVPFGVVHKLPVLVRFTVFREQTGAQHPLRPDALPTGHRTAPAG